MNPPPLKVIYASSKPMWLSKVCLRGISAAAAISLLGLVAATAAGVNHREYWYGDPYWFPLAVSGIQLVLIFCWDIAEVACLFARKGNRGIHPGACVAVDLLLWMGMLSAAVLLSLICWDLCWVAGPSPEAGRDAMVALSAILTILHFVLFVIACTETSVRNRAVRVILDRNGAPLKGTEPEYKLYQSYGAQHEQYGQQQQQIFQQPTAPPPVHGSTQAAPVGV